MNTYCISYKGLDGVLSQTAQESLHPEGKSGVSHTEVQALKARPPDGEVQHGVGIMLAIFCAFCQHSER
jgi:hypothetical protein